MSEPTVARATAHTPTSLTTSSKMITRRMTRNAFNAKRTWRLLGPGIRVLPWTQRVSTRTPSTTWKPSSAMATTTAGLWR